MFKPGSQIWWTRIEKRPEQADTRHTTRVTFIGYMKNTGYPLIRLPSGARDVLFDSEQLSLKCPMQEGI